MAYKSKSKLKTYKLRAEGLHDILVFLISHGRYVENYVIHGNKSIPDVEFEFQSLKSKESIYNDLRLIPDGHVMVDTFELKSKYTGKR